MKKAAIILAPNFEESEALTIIDIIRRANLVCDIIGLEKEIEGTNKIIIRADKIINNDLLEYDMLILSCGTEDVEVLDNEQLIRIIKKINKSKKYIALTFMTSTILEKIGILKNENIIINRGIATSYDFAYKIVDLLEGDSLSVKKRMLYLNAFSVEECKGR